MEDLAGDDDEIKWISDGPLESTMSQFAPRDELLTLQEQSFGNEELSDFKIQVGDQTFNVNSYFLCIHSAVFTSYLSNDSEEKRTKTIKIRDLDPELVKAMLKFMYSGKVDNLEQIAHDLYVVADRYDVKILQKICLQHMFNNLDMQHIFKCLELAFELNIEELKQKSIDFAIAKKNEVQCHEEWEPLVARCAQVGITFMRRLTAEANELKKRNEELEARRCPHQSERERSSSNRESFANIDQYLREIEEFNALLAARRSEFERALADPPRVGRPLGNFRAERGLEQVQRLRQLREMNDQFQVRGRLQNIINDANAELRQRENADEVVVVAERPQRNPPLLFAAGQERRVEQIERSRHEMRRLQSDIDRDRDLIQRLNNQHREIEARQQVAANEEANMELNSLRVRRRVLEEHLDNLRQRFFQISRDVDNLQRENRRVDRQRQSLREFQELERNVLGRRRQNPFQDVNVEEPPAQRIPPFPPALILPPPLLRPAEPEQLQNAAIEPPRLIDPPLQRQDVEEPPALIELRFEDVEEEPRLVNVPEQRQNVEEPENAEPERREVNRRPILPFFIQEGDQERERQQINLHDHDYQPIQINNPTNNSTPDRDQIIDIDSNDEDIFIVEDGQEGAKRGRRSQRINYRELTPDEPGPSRKLPTRRGGKLHWKHKLMMQRAASQMEPKSKSKEKEAKPGQKRKRNESGKKTADNVFESETSQGNSQEVILDQQNVHHEVILDQADDQEKSQELNQAIPEQQQNGQETEEEEQPGPSKQKPAPKKKGRPRLASLNAAEEQPGPSRVNKKRASQTSKKPLPGEYPFQLSSDED